MLTENRKYNYLGEINLSRSRLLDKNTQPKDDKVNWLFLKINHQQFSFVYKMEDPLNSHYDKPFKAALAFTMQEEVEKLFEFSKPYEILRGQEIVGTLKLINVLV